MQKEKEKERDNVIIRERKREIISGKGLLRNN